MIGLVLDNAGKKIFSNKFKRFSVLIKGFYFDFRVPLYLAIDDGN
jgi:hypothetical protein